MHRVAAPLALLLTAVATPSAPAATARTLTVSASRAAYLDVRLTRTTVLALDRISVTGGRRYAGVVLSALDPAATRIELLHVRFLELPASPSEATLSNAAGGNRLPPGRYRLYVLADGPATVRIPAQGLTQSSRLRATTPVRPRYRMVDVPQRLDPVYAPYGGATRLPVDTRAGNDALVRFGATFQSAPASVDGWSICPTATGEAECLPPPYVDWVRYGVNTGEKTFDLWEYTRYLRPGTYDYTAMCRGLAPAKRCRLAVLDRFRTDAKSTGTRRL